MAAYDADIFNVDPYYDDYSDSKKFLRVLYKPGVALQARELTQTQTILQTQLQRFGDNIFKDGSIVTESQVVLNPVKFIRIGGLTGYSGVSISDFAGLTASVSGKNTIQILDVLGALTGSNTDNTSLLFYSEYLAGATAFALNDTISANLSGTVISGTVTGGAAASDAYTGAPSSLPAFGTASLIGLDSGVRYIKGYFVNHDSQQLVPYNITGTAPNNYRQFNNLNSVVNLGVTNTIVTSDSDTSLNDPAFGSYNYQAPGADRYRIDLTLGQLPLSATADYTLITIKNGEATYKTNYPEYNVLADTLARRTYDESGNYTLDDFPIKVTDNANETQLDVNIGKGKAYIFGYEFINQANKTLTIPKARTLKTIPAAQDIPTIIGNEANVQFNPAITGSSYINTINFNSSPLFYVGGGTGALNVPLGTVRVGRLNVITSGTYSCNLYDFNLTSGYTAGNAKTLFYPGRTGANQCTFLFTDTPLTLAKTTYNGLLFPLANDITAYAVFGINQQQFIVQKSLSTTLTSTSNTIYTSDFGFSTGTWHEFNSVNDIKVLSATGTSVSVSGAAFGVNNRTLSFTTGATGPVTIFAAINVNETSGTVSFKRSKTASTKTANVVIRNNGLEEYAYLNGDVDVTAIVSITGHFGAGATSQLSSYFDLDDGQKDDIYDWSRIVLKRDYFNTGITGVSVTYTKYDRSGTDGPFIMDSYGSTAGIGISGYKQIPIYNFKGRSGKTVSLGGCYDFRPDRQTPSGFTGTDVPTNYGATGNLSQLDDVVINGTWNYYLPRTDKIVLTKNKEFAIVSGVETEQAPEPSDLNDAMTLGTVFLNPFTKTAVDTSQFLVKNRRYTMKDIGGIDKRVGRLEYYTTLSLSEKDAKNLDITDASGLNKFKNGIFVDDFTSKSNSNYSDLDNSCAIDPEKKETRPKFITKYMDFGLTGTIPSGLTNSPDGIITFNYTTSKFVSQPLASKAINVNPYNVTNFNGLLNLVPSSDDWVDTTRNPDVVINLQGQNDGISDNTAISFGTVWNNWQTNWAGQLVGATPWNTTGNILAPEHTLLAPDGTYKTQAQQTRLAIQQTSQSRTGTKLTISPETITKNIGDRVVDISVVPYIRHNSVTVTAKGMRPNVRVYPFFDNTDVSAYCTVAGVTAAAMVTDSEGKLGYSSVIKFEIPASIFRTGERLFRLIDSTSNTVASCTTTAEQIYRAQGLLKTEESTIVSTRALHIKRENVKEERVFNNVVSQSVTNWIDPLAQTFFIDPLVYPSGIFIKKATIYFKSKSSTLPVNIQIRPTTNGYPSSSTIVPFTDVYKSPSEITTSTDGSVGTDFEFSSPIMLQPGEYALTVLSNSNDYEIFVSEIGQNDTISGLPITAQPYAGSLFKSQNSSTWTAEQTLDMKFDIHKCNFTYDQANSEVSFSFVETDFTTGYSNITNGMNVFRLNSTFITPANTSVENTIQTKSAGSLNSEIIIQNNQNYTFPIKTTMSSVLNDTVKVNYYLSVDDGSTAVDISPILDTERVSGLYIQNILNYVSNSTTKDQYESLASIRGITATTDLSYTRYISKKVNLADGFESDTLDVYLSARLPVNSDVRAYMKTQTVTDNTNFDNIVYEPLVIHPSYAIPYGTSPDSSRYVSAGEDDYVDLRFTRGLTAMSSGITGQNTFKSFQVKVVVYGDSINSLVPSFKDFKVIAT